MSSRDRMYLQITGNPMGVCANACLFVIFFVSRSHVSTVTLLLHSLGPNVSAAPTLRRSTALHRPANSASSSVPSTGRTREGERWPVAHARSYYSSTHTACVLPRCMCVMWFTPLWQIGQSLFPDFSTLKAWACRSLFSIKRSIMSVFNYWTSCTKLLLG